MQKRPDPWWDITKMICALLALLFFFALITDFPRATATPEGGGGWFYEYQNLFAGLLAALGGFLAYRGMREQIDAEHNYRQGLSQDLFMKFEQDSKNLRGYLPVLFMSIRYDYKRDIEVYVVRVFWTQCIKI